MKIINVIGVRKIKESEILEFKKST